jgi:hypothetical protein
MLKTAALVVRQIVGWATITACFAGSAAALALTTMTQTPTPPEDIISINNELLQLDISVND